MRKDTPKLDSASMPTWETLEAFARSQVQRFVQTLLEEEITALLGRARSQRRAAVDAPRMTWSAAGESSSSALMNASRISEVVTIRACRTISAYRTACFEMVAAHGLGWIVLVDILGSDAHGRNDAENTISGAGMTRDVATEMATLVFGCSSSLERSVSQFKGKLPPPEFERYRRAVAEVIATLIHDVLEPIYQEYPDLKPY